MNIYSNKFKFKKNYIMVELLTIRESMRESWQKIFII